MKRNYLTVASFLALMVALPLPFAMAMVFTEQVARFGSQLGAGVYLLMLLWMRTWTLIGILAGVIALRFAFGGCGSRVLACVATGTNVLLFVMTLDNFWKLFR